MRGRTLSKHLSSARQYFVQRLAEIWGGVGHLPAHLLGILFPALLDLLVKELLEVAIAETFLTLSRMVHDHVGDECSRETAGLEGGILR